MIRSFRARVRARYAAIAADLAAFLRQPVNLEPVTYFFSLGEVCAAPPPFDATADAAAAAAAAAV